MKKSDKRSTGAAGIRVTEKSVTVTKVLQKTSRDESVVVRFHGDAARIWTGLEQRTPDLSSSERLISFARQVTDPHEIAAAKYQDFKEAAYGVFLPEAYDAIALFDAALRALRSGHMDAVQFRRRLGVIIGECKIIDSFGEPITQSATQEAKP